MRYSIYLIRFFTKFAVQKFNVTTPNSVDIWSRNRGPLVLFHRYGMD